MSTDASAAHAPGGTYRKWVVHSGRELWRRRGGIMLETVKVGADMSRG
jgi:hypothetical protein